MYSDTVVDLMVICMMKHCADIKMCLCSRYCGVTPWACSVWFPGVVLWSYLILSRQLKVLAGPWVDCTIGCRGLGRDLLFISKE